MIPRNDEIFYIREPQFLYCTARAVGSAAHAVVRGWNVRAARCATAVEMVVPDACAELFVSLGPFGRHLVSADAVGASFAPRHAWIVGPHATSVFLRKEIAECDIVAVRIQPAMIAGILGVPASELTGRLLDLELFWGHGAVAELRDRLFEEPDALARVRLLEREVARRSMSSAYDGLSVRQLCSAMEHVPSLTVGAIARRFGLSHRRVIALFDEHIGLKPKIYQRVLRLRRVLERVAEHGVGSWARLAYEFGYSDQSHFVNEFQRLTGLTPSLYEQRRSRLWEATIPHVPANPASA